MRHESEYQTSRTISSQHTMSAGLTELRVSLTVLWFIGSLLGLNVPSDALAGVAPPRPATPANLPPAPPSSPSSSFDWLRDPAKRQQEFDRSQEKQQAILAEKERARPQYQPTALDRAVKAGAENVPGWIRDREESPAGPVAEILLGSPETPNRWASELGPAVGEAHREIEQERRVTDQAARQQGFTDSTGMVSPANRLTEPEITALRQSGAQIGAAPTSMDATGGMKRNWTVDEAREWALNQGYTGVPVLYDDPRTGEAGFIAIRATEFLSDGGRCRDFENVWLPGGNEFTGPQQPIYQDQRTACSYGTLQRDWSIDGASIENTSSGGRAGDNIDQELANLVGEVDRSSRLETDVSRSQYDRGAFDTALGAVDQRIGQMQQDNQRRVQDGLSQLADAAMSAMRAAQQRAQQRARNRQVAQSQSAPSQPPRPQTARTTQVAQSQSAPSPPSRPQTLTGGSQGPQQQQRYCGQRCALWNDPCRVGNANYPCSMCKVWTTVCR